MIASSSALDTLKRARPEWLPWLAVLEEVVREANSPQWERAVPGEIGDRNERVPLLAGSAVSLQTSSVRRWLDRLIRLATESGTDAMRSLARTRVAEADCVELFTASIRHDTEAARQMAAAHQADPEALQAVIALLPVPFLLACNRRMSMSVPAGWTEGYCPLCGSWPAFAEIRGIERSRYFRCARCGGEWYARALVCPFCDTSDHNELATLVPAKSDANGTIDACNGCRGYVKAFTRLQGCPPAAVMIEDLASVELDLAALEQGYARPAGAGYPVDVSVIEGGARRRFFGWGP
jgi:FdhE protein